MPSIVSISPSFTSSLTAFLEPQSECARPWRVLKSYIISILDIPSPKLLLMFTSSPRVFDRTKTMIFRFAGLQPEYGSGFNLGGVEGVSWEESWERRNSSSSSEVFFGDLETLSSPLRNLFHPLGVCPSSSPSSPDWTFGLCIGCEEGPSPRSEWPS